VNRHPFVRHFVILSTVSRRLPNIG